MSNWHIKTPIAFIIFNRPDTTERVFAEIAKAKPPKLLVIADGPRENRPGEQDKCAATRAIIDRVDWHCEILTNYSEVNLGCKKRVSSGLDWVFQQVEETIILEDDCLPHPSFFRYCEELLDKYRDDYRIAQISGNNFQFGRKRTNDSYYFSRFTHIWGWASWRRAWRHYDVDLSLWAEVKEGGWLEDALGDSKQIKYWRSKFDKVINGEINTWDYQWLFICWMNNALTVLPNVNLVSNIGFGQDATHTIGESHLANMNTEEMSFPLIHPKLMVRDVRADKETIKEQFVRISWSSLVRRCILQIKRTRK